MVRDIVMLARRGRGQARQVNPRQVGSPDSKAVEHSAGDVAERHLDLVRQGHGVAMERMPTDHVAFVPGASRDVGAVSYPFEIAIDQPATQGSVVVPVLKCVSTQKNAVLE